MMGRLWILVAVLVGAVAGVAAAGQPVAVLPVKEVPAFEVEIGEFGPMVVAFVEHTGSYDEMEKEVPAFYRTLTAQHIKPSGPLVSIYLNDPGTTPEDELRWQLAVEVPEEIVIEEPLDVRVLPACSVARTQYKGPLDKIGVAYERLVGAAVEHGFRPVGPAIELSSKAPVRGQIECTIMLVIEGGPAEELGICAGAELVIIEPRLLVFAEHTGGLDRIGPETEAFLAELEKQRVEPAGPLMTIFPEVPGEGPPEQLHWRVAVPIPEEREVAEPLKLQGVPERVMARMPFGGPDEEVGVAGRGLIEYAAGRGYVPTGPLVMTLPIPLPRPEGAPAEEEAHEPRPERTPPERVLMFGVEKMPPIQTELVIFGPRPLVYVGHTGPLEQMNAAAQEFAAQLEKQGIHPAGPLLRTFYNAPEGTPEGELYWELAVPIAEEREVGEPLKLKIVPECAYARANYQGPVAGVRTAHDIMREQAAGRGWFPAGPLIQVLPEPAHGGRVECVLMFVVAKGEPGPRPEREPEPGGETEIKIKPIPAEIIKPKPVIE